MAYSNTSEGMLLLLHSSRAFELDLLGKPERIKTVLPESIITSNVNTFCEGVGLAG